MGQWVSKSELEAQRRHNELMELQRVQFERQLTLQNMMWERTNALSTARAKEAFYFSAICGAFCCVSFAFVALRTGNMLLPLAIFPIACGVGYQGNRVLGSYPTQINKMAEQVLLEEPEICKLMPRGQITFDDVEKRRHQTNDEARFQTNVYDVSL